MKTLRIGFDFDKIFAGYPPIIPAVVIDYLYKKRDKHLEYRMPGRFEQYLRIISHHYLLRRPIVENVEALKKIVRKKNVVAYVISSRFSFLKERTEAWDRKYNIARYFEKMFFNFGDEQPHEFKERIIREEKLDKFVDDDLDLILYLAKRNPKVRFYWIGKYDTKKMFPKNVAYINNLNTFLNKYV